MIFLFPPSSLPSFSFQFLSFMFFRSSLLPARIREKRGPTIEAACRRSRPFFQPARYAKRSRERRRRRRRGRRGRIDGWTDRQTDTDGQWGGRSRNPNPSSFPAQNIRREIPLQLAMPPPGSFSASKTVFRIHILAPVELSRGLRFVHRGMRQCTAGFLTPHRLRGRTNSPQKNRSEMSSAKYLPSSLARSLDRAAAAGGHARVPPIRLSRSAAARPRDHPAVLLARDPLFCPP